MLFRQIFFLFLILALVSHTCAFFDWSPWFPHKNKDKSSSSSEEHRGWRHHKWRPFGRGKHEGLKNGHHHHHHHLSTLFPNSTVSPPSTTN